MKVNTLNSNRRLATALQTYLQLLRRCGTEIAKLSKSHSGDPLGDDLFAAWRQANWELLVEGPLRESDDFRLEVLDGSADYWPESARMLEPTATPTHQIRFRTEPGLRDTVEGRPGSDHRFDGFVDVSTGWPVRHGEIDSVIEEAGDDVLVFPISMVAFYVAPLYPNE